MQEIHSIGGGRFFSGGGGDRRLRPHPHHQNHQALKCPRCDSLNTKFCYYNNYNLSQPRHFCKNCRRYWTKGGVLRNVPVGGGCRKSKRSNNKPAKNNSSSSSETATATKTSTTQPPPEPQRKSNSHSSSESSSLTAAAAASAATETTSNFGSNNKLLDSNNINEAKLFSNPVCFELEQGGGGGGDCSIYSEIGSFTSLITCSSNNEALGFGFGNNIYDASQFRFSAQHSTDPHLHAQCQWQQQKVVSINSDHYTHLDHQDMKFPDITGSLLDHTVPVGHGGFGSLDWHDGADQGLFDLPNTVDQPYNWTHSIHWSDQDNPRTLSHLP